MLAIALTTAIQFTAGPQPGSAMALPPCGRALSVSIDRGDGAFDGMSQSGGWLVVRNQASRACKVEALPRVEFEAHGRALPAVRSAPVGMHPGPVMLPVALAPGATATTALRWVSSDVYDGHNCINPARIVIHINGMTFRRPFSGMICGAAGAPVSFKQPPLKLGRPDSD